MRPPPQRSESGGQLKSKVEGKRRAYDAVVVGSGPNGLAAAITLAQARKSVLVVERNDTVGGGTRSAELTLPGFVHDVCSAVYPLGVGSPFFQTLPLDAHGLQWIHPPAPIAHPFDDGTAIVLERSIEQTAANLGRDGSAYRRLMAPLVAHWDKLLADMLGPFRLPRHPMLMARFGMLSIRSASGLARGKFKDARARALFAGLGGHSMLPLDTPMTAAFGLVLGASGHAVGWPISAGGAGKISEALSSYLLSIGGEIVTGNEVESIDQLPPSQAVLCDVTPRQILSIAGHRLPRRYARKLAGYRYGVGVFKVDWALDGPIPWTAPECARAGTVHLGGSLEEVAVSERAASEGEHHRRPFVLLAQPSLFDPTRAPEGKHVVWSYCHVPNGSTFDMADRIQSQIERFAPGFGDLVLARHSRFPADLEEYNPNYVGGDINGGVQDIRQHFTRPMLRVVPYSTPVKGLYICSSSTPPGGGVHGMCGSFAARAALRQVF